MNLKKIITLLLIPPVLSGCHHLIMRSGDIAFKKEVTKIPFEYRQGLPIIKVKINEESYDFLFDTGASNTISQELTKKINAKTKGFQGVIDSQRNKSILKIIQLDTISIGGYHFLNTGAIVANLNKSIAVNCLDIDGIIGSNLIQLANWEIDFKNQIIKISSSENQFKVSHNADTIKYKTDIYYKQYIDLKIGNIKIKNLTFDTGSNGYITCSGKDYKKLINNDLLSETNYGYGVSSSGLFGKGKPDSVFYATTNSLTFGNTQINHPILEFREKHSNMIGTDFLKKFTVILIPGEKEIILSKVDDREELARTFGFGFFPYANSLKVDYIINNSIAAKKGLKLNDRIVEINGMDVHSIDTKCYCDIQNKILSKKNSITITIHRKDNEIELELFKTPIF